jgi:hypothetical protein
MSGSLTIFGPAPFKPSPLILSILDFYHINLQPLLLHKEHPQTFFSQPQPSSAMSDSDGELDLLKSSQTVRIMGEHETKTSPLVTRDAVLLSDQFAQRGVLGTVLSVHADGIPGNTIDPRIYLNLNAPSSGLVCGVQVRLWQPLQHLLNCFVIRGLERVTPCHAF